MVIATLSQLLSTVVASNSTTTATEISLVSPLHTVLLPLDMEKETARQAIEMADVDVAVSTIQGGSVSTISEVLSLDINKESIRHPLRYSCLTRSVPTGKWQSHVITTSTRACDNKTCQRTTPSSPLSLSLSHTHIFRLLSSPPYQ
jgi:hypothetical protein